MSYIIRKSQNDVTVSDLYVMDVAGSYVRDAYTEHRDTYKVHANYTDIREEGRVWCGNEGLRLIETLTGYNPVGHYKNTGEMFDVIPHMGTSEYMKCSIYDKGGNIINQRIVKLRGGEGAKQVHTVQLKITHEKGEAPTQITWGMMGYEGQSPPPISSRGDSSSSMFYIANEYGQYRSKEGGTCYSTKQAMVYESWEDAYQIWTIGYAKGGDDPWHIMEYVRHNPEQRDGEVI